MATYNLGIPGETTDGLIKRFQAEVGFRLGDAADAIFIFEYGANDAAFVPDGSFLVSVERFIDNLTKVLGQAKRLGGMVMILDITPVVEDAVNSSEVAKSRLNQHVQHYNQELAKLSEQEGVTLVKINEAFMLKEYQTLFCEDGLHPNSRGHKLIFEEVSKALPKF